MLQGLDLFIESLFLGIFVISVLQELVLELQELRVCCLAALHLPGELVLKQCHGLEMILLHACLLLSYLISLLLELIVREKKSLHFLLKPCDLDIALEQPISRVNLSLLLGVGKLDFVLLLGQRKFLLRCLLRLLSLSQLHLRSLGFILRLAHFLLPSGLPIFHFLLHLVNPLLKVPLKHRQSRNLLSQVLDQTALVNDLLLQILALALQHRLFVLGPGGIGQEDRRLGLRKEGLDGRLVFNWLEEQRLR